MNRHVPDGNVFLAFVWPRHEGHAAAHAWFEKSGHPNRRNVFPSKWVCRWTYNEAMSGSIRLTPHGEALLQAQLAKGTYRSPEEVIERALEILAQRQGGSPSQSVSTKSPAEAVADIQETRKGVALGGLKIRDLIHEGRKH